MKEISEAIVEATFLEAVDHFSHACNNVLNAYKLILELETLLEQSEESIKKFGYILK